MSRVVFFSKAGESVGNGMFLRIWCEIEEDERLALTEKRDRFAVVADIRFEGDDPCVGLDLLASEYDLASVMDFYGVFGFETGAEMDAPRLICMDVNEDAIGDLADQDSPGKSGLPEAVRGGESVGLCGLILEVYRGLVSRNPVDVEFYGCLGAHHLGG